MSCTNSTRDKKKAKRASALSAEHSKQSAMRHQKRAIRNDKQRTKRSAGPSRAIVTTTYRCRRRGHRWSGVCCGRIHRKRTGTFLPGRCCSCDPTGRRGHKSLPPLMSARRQPLPRPRAPPPTASQEWVWAKHGNPHERRMKEVKTE